MSDLIVMTFDTEDEAARVRAAMTDLEERGLLSLNDAAVIRVDREGELHTVDEPSRGARTGAIVGGALGLLLTFMFPVVGVVFGAGAGALVGRSLDDQVERRFIDDVEESLRPGTSALFLLVRSANNDALLAALREFKGQVYQTTVGPELEEQLRSALE